MLPYRDGVAQQELEQLLRVRRRARALALAGPLLFEGQQILQDRGEIQLSPQ